MLSHTCLLTSALVAPRPSAFAHVASIHAHGMGASPWLCRLCCSAVLPACAVVDAAVTWKGATAYCLVLRP